MRRPNDPLTSTRFVLELGFIETASFSECVGLGTETSLFEYREGGRNYSVLKFPEGGQISNVTLKRGILTGASSDVLFKWHADVMNGAFNGNANPNSRPADSDSDIDRSVSIVMQDEMGAEVKRWSLFRALPVKWIGPEFKANANEVALETLELACEGIELSSS